MTTYHFEPTRARRLSENRWCCAYCGYQGNKQNVLIHFGKKHESHAESVSIKPLSKVAAALLVNKWGNK